MDEIILIGTGGHCRSCIDVIESSNRYKIAGLVVKDQSVINQNLNYPILGMDEDLPLLRKKYNFAIVAIGQIKTAKPRIKIFNILKSLNYKLPVIISSQAYVSSKSLIGPGTIIMHNAIVNSNVQIGGNCIINAKALIEHDSKIGENSHISTGAIINGEVEVGQQTFVGSGAIISNCIKIGEKSIIGAGSVIKKNISSNSIIIN